MSRPLFWCAGLLTVLASSQFAISQDANQAARPASSQETTKPSTEAAAADPQVSLQIVGPTSNESTVQELVRRLASTGIAIPTGGKIEDVDPFDLFVVMLTVRAEEPFENLKQLLEGMRSRGVTKISLTAATPRTSYNSATVRVSGSAPHKQVERLLDFLAKQSHVKLTFEVVGATTPVVSEPQKASTAAGPPNPLVKLFALQHTRAEEVAEILKQLYKSPVVEFGAVGSSNSLVVRGEQSLLDEIEAILLRLDQEENPRAVIRDRKSDSSQLPALSQSDLQTTEKIPPGQRPSVQATAAEVTEWKHRYEAAERRAAAIAKQLRDLQENGSAKETRLSEVRAELRQTVADAFSARQSAQTAELIEFQSRAVQIQRTIAMRNGIKDQIIDRRVEDLLNPALKWEANGNSAAPLEKQRQKGSTQQQNPNTSNPPSRSNPIENESSATTKEAPISPGTPLSDVVRAFNEKYASHPVGKDQPPLTDDEVVAAIRWGKHVKSGEPLGGGIFRSEQAEIDASLDLFKAVAENRRVPPSLQLEWNSHVYLPDNTNVVKWSIYLSHRRPKDAKVVGALLVREQCIRWQAPGGGTIKRSEPSAADSADPGNRPLAAAIQAFNAQHESDSIGKDQPPLTEDEVIAAIRNWKTKRNEADVSNAVFDAFQAIADTRVLPPKFEFEVLSGFRPNQTFEFDAWSVRIRVPKQSDGGGTYAFTIRDRWIRSRRIDDREISWGPAGSNGIQAGVLFDPASEQYANGQKIQPRFFFRNVGSQQMSVAFPRLMTHSYYDELRAVDATGRDIPVDQDSALSGPVGWIQTPLNPSHQHEIAGRTIVVGDIPREESVETVIRAQPGQACRIRFTVPNYGERDSLPLETGEIQFTLK